MKNYIVKKVLSALLILITCFSFSNCGETENKIFDPVNSQTLVKLTSSFAILPVLPTGVSSQTLTFEVTKLSDEDRLVILEVDDASTATNDQYLIPEMIIPAGSYTGSGEITAIYENIPESGSVDLIVNVVGISGDPDAAIDNSTFTLTMERFCPLVVEDFYGTYTALGSFNDRDNLTERPDIIISEGPEGNTIRLTNIHASGRQAVLQMDYTDINNPRIYHRSFEFGAAFQSSPNYTYAFEADQGNNTFNTCQKTITLRFFRLNSTGTGVFGGEYNYILTKQ